MSLSRVVWESRVQPYFKPQYVVLDALYLADISPLLQPLPSPLSPKASVWTHAVYFFDNLQSNLLRNGLHITGVFLPLKGFLFLAAEAYYL